MSYECKWDMAKELTKQYQIFPSDLQNAIDDFTDLLEQHGLGDFSLFPGKISNSWKNASPVDASFALKNNLWHYHLGIPEYRISISGKYKTSDWLLHFQWKKGENEVLLIDAYQHYKDNKSFYMPDKKYLEKKALDN